MTHPEWATQYPHFRDLDGGTTYLIIEPLWGDRARLSVATKDGTGEHW